MTNVYLIIVYRMDRLCGGAHEISGIKAPLFLCGGVGGGVRDGGVGGGVGGCAWCAGEGCCGWWREGGWWHG